MRHNVKGRKLGRTASHRAATLNSLATALIKHKKIKTTVAKAKETRVFVEPLITKAKNDTVHARRIIARHINDKDVIKELFTEVVQKIGDRPGGYTRIVKLGNRLGDAAEMAIIELVDYNDGNPSKPKKTQAKSTSKTKKEKAEVVEESAGEEKEVKTVKKTSKKKENVGDDLTKVEGIGPKIAEVLVSAEISTFSILAKTEVEKLQEILAAAGSQFTSHDPGTWPQQASLAAEEKWDELKKLQDELDGGRAKE